MDCRDDIKEGRRLLMVVVLGGRVIGYHRDLDNKGVRKEAASENCGICSRDTNI